MRHERCGGSTPSAVHWQQGVRRFGLGRVDPPLLRGGLDRACRDSAVEAEDAPTFYVGTSRAHRI